MQNDDRSTMMSRSESRPKQQATVEYGSSLPAMRTAVVDAGQIPTLLKSNELLTLFRFSGATAIDQQDARQVSVGLDSLDPTEQAEVWLSADTVTQGQQGRIRCNQDGNILFGHLWVADDRNGDLADTALSVYSEIIGFLRTSDYPYLFRCWNYLPYINRTDSGLERYRAFCVGRHAAFSNEPGFESSLPAATAIGTQTPGLLVSFAASRRRPIQIENPRQVSAFHYPPKHSPRSPLFSRAVWMNWASCQRLYLSGTASIQGHESLHDGDLSGQVKETLQNIAAIQANASDDQPTERVTWVQGESLRVYLRHAKHYAAVRKALESHWGKTHRTIYLKGDICRSELLLEIEGVFGQAGT